MKISKSVQRRTVIFAAMAALVALFQVTHLLAQLFSSNNISIGENSPYYIGELDVSYAAFYDEDNKDDAIVITRDADGEPLVEAMPSSLMFFSRNPHFQLPDHYGWAANRIIVYAVIAAFVIIVFLVAWILFGAIHGFRTENIFRHNHPTLLRWLALATFIYFILVNNRLLFMQIATKSVYGVMSPIEVFGSASFGPEVLIVPLLLLIFAELMAVAARINEEESMTI